MTKGNTDDDKQTMETSTMAKQKTIKAYTTNKQTRTTQGHAYDKPNYTRATHPSQHPVTASYVVPRRVVLLCVLFRRCMRSGVAVVVVSSPNRGSSQEASMSAPVSVFAKVCIQQRKKIVPYTR